MFELRQIDELGRVAIPKEIRERISIGAGALIIIDEGKTL